MSLTFVAMVNQVPPGTMKSFSAGGKPILIANVEGKFYAINNFCTHLGGDLSHGKLDGKIVTCPRHHSRFDVTTGKNLSGPKYWIFTLKTGNEPSYPVTIEGNNIKIDLG
jgi:nitrite reductase/ring-hydroxylating ferredoxin subunit